MAAIDDLEIIKMAEAIADGMWNRVGQFDDFAKDTLGRQLVRAVDSIGANLAESCGRFHFGDKLLFLYYARGSLFETKYWINRSFKRKLIVENETCEVIDKLNDLARRLNVFARGLKQVKQSSQVGSKTLREESEPYLAGEDVDAELIDARMFEWLSDLSIDTRYERPSSNY
jgi:four helix bundle protein